MTLPYQLPARFWAVRLLRLLAINLGEDDATLYAKERANGSPAQCALGIVRYRRKFAGSPLLRLRDNMDGRHAIVLPIGEGLEARCRIEPDHDADLSFYGEFSNTKEAGAIKHSEGTRGEYRYFIPGYDYLSDGNSREVARAHAMRDYRRMLDYGQGWAMVGVVVTFHHMDIPDLELASGSLWGTESDSDREHFAEIALDLIREHKDEALAELARIRTKLCMSA